MCWISEDKPIKMIADKDIPCAKIMEKLTGKLRSLYYGKNYKLGETYSMESEIAVCHHYYDSFGHVQYEIDEGFHSYRPDICRIYKNNVFELFVNECFDSMLMPTDVIVDCIIPKGTVYYENEAGELVSERIKIISYKDISEVARDLDAKKE